MAWPNAFARSGSKFHSSGFQSFPARPDAERIDRLPQMRPTATNLAHAATFYRSRHPSDNVHRLPANSIPRKKNVKVHRDQSRLSAASRDLLNPLAPPGGRLEGIREILCLAHDLSVAELHNTHCVCWSPLVRDCVFRDPEITVSENSLDVEA
jgi:hypothetical protein